MSHGPSMSETTTLQALMTLLKCYIGTGILSMPKAFADSGYIFGVLGVILIGFLCNLCIHMLVQINQVLVTKPEQIPYDYQELAQLSFENGPKKLREYGQMSRKILTICLCLSQTGFCCAYALFIAKNLLQFAINLEIGFWHEDDVVYFLCLLLPIMIALNFIKSIYHLSLGSLFANVVQMASLLIILYNLVTNIPYIGDRKPFNHKLPQFVSTTAFTFEGITVTMPLYRSMKKRENFAKPFGVLNMAILFVIILYSSVGFLGYLKYGEDVGASITFSLPNEPLYIAVQFMYAFSITFSYPIQMYVAIHLMWPTIRDYLMERKKSELIVNMSDYMFRSSLVILTFVLAASIPELDLIIELIGAFACTSVAIIIPTVLHLVTFFERKSGLSRKWLIIKNTSILVFGLLVLCTGTYFSLVGIVERFQEKVESFDAASSSSPMFDNNNNNNNSSVNVTGKMPFWFDKLINLTHVATTNDDQSLNL
ncbi:hypothetical protein HUG17_5512 [Dermatophagoides farinae]|uniref:Amino acid transporter transmembrane domain-containing protein n=1 Tax=Dermatophagoides farinae TaxID=6954 RepID=A0A9D4P1U4_DERFA|nr:proton-coupled amino acid transporter-like protein CG1139 [Dermatophagoides farinae]KAH7642467.1 hypothetical protein HUG17_5512 [Dermatophagoides farinae]